MSFVIVENNGESYELQSEYPVLVCKTWEQAKIAVSRWEAWMKKAREAARATGSSTIPAEFKKENPPPFGRAGGTMYDVDIEEVPDYE